jgi:hypothetical protein
VGGDSPTVKLVLGEASEDKLVSLSPRVILDRSNLPVLLAKDRDVVALNYLR